jgi:hypothetical protein
MAPSSSGTAVWNFKSWNGVTSNSNIVKTMTVIQFTNLWFTALGRICFFWWLTCEYLGVKIFLVERKLRTNMAERQGREDSPHGRQSRESSQGRSPDRGRPSYPPQLVDPDDVETYERHPLPKEAGYVSRIVKEASTHMLLCVSQLMFIGVEKSALTF